jgi:uncharacterized GH25 family protein
MRAWLVIALGLLPAVATAHDTWVEANTPLVRVGDRVEFDLKLGNHGNNHRDFKLAGKVTLDSHTLEVIEPSGKRYDLKPELADVGYAAKEGYLTAGYVPGEPGHYTLLATSDRVVNHGSPERSVRSAKTVILATHSLDRPTAKTASFRKPANLPFELVLLSDPVLFAGPGNPLEVQVLSQGKPVADCVVSFIPRGVELAEGFDEKYERRTNPEGKCSFTPTAGNVFLIVAHRTADDERTAEFERTKYAATLTVRVPQICPCCDE